MTRSDPFTTDKARVPLQASGSEATRQQHLANAQRPAIRQAFGPTGEVKWVEHFGAGVGHWKAGYTSAFGFHTRGEGPTAAEAVAAAIKSRLPDDPGGPV